MVIFYSLQYIKYYQILHCITYSIFPIFYVLLNFNAKYYMINDNILVHYERHDILICKYCILFCYIVLYQTDNILYNIIYNIYISYIYHNI